MKLTKAEYRLLDSALNSSNMMFSNGFMFTEGRVSRKLVHDAILKGLISQRAWKKGYVVATAAGRRSHSYGPR